MAESSHKGWQTQWQKEKLLITSNFSFSQSVFKRLVQHIRKNQGLFWKGLTRGNILGFLSERMEIIVEKGENAGYQHFFLFKRRFQKPSLSGVVKFVLKSSNTFATAFLNDFLQVKD